MDADHQIRLRLRFYKDVTETLGQVRQKFELFSQNKSPDFKVNACDDHVWIHIAGAQKKYWSPHLHLQLEPTETNGTHIRGLFGPDQTLWTLFMLFHFIVGGVFVIFSMIAYSNYTLKQPLFADFLVMGLMVVVWFLLYFVARQIRHNGNGQMQDLENLFLKIMET